MLKRAERQQWGFVWICTSLKEKLDVQCSMRQVWMDERR